MAPNAGQSAVTVYPVTNYSFGSKPHKQEKDHNVAERMARLKSNYDRDGMRRSVDGVLLVHEHNHPHVLLLQYGMHFFKLPGGRLKPGEDAVTGLRRKLADAHPPVSPLLLRCAECVALPQSMTSTPPFPFPSPPPLCAWDSEVQECKKLFLVPLAERSMFAVPRNVKLVAVPLFELYDNVPRYGPVISAIPAMLSRYRVNVVSQLPLLGTVNTLPQPPMAPQQQQQQQQHQQYQQMQ
ncbi:MAG: hypothetical protein WDW38_009386 [Sanguina aurantia]